MTRQFLAFAAGTFAILVGLTLFQQKLAPADSGIYGTVTIGPTCPVQRVGDNSCADRPYQATVAIYLVKPGTAIPMLYPTPPGSVATVRKVTTFTTDAWGKFRVGLAPGSYVLRKDSPNAFPSLPDVIATVTAGNFTKVDLSFDSGIR